MTAIRYGDKVALLHVKYDIVLSEDDSGLLLTPSDPREIGHSESFMI